jgi:hypothetical protein
VLLRLRDFADERLTFFLLSLRCLCGNIIYIKIDINSIRGIHGWNSCVVYVFIIILLVEAKLGVIFLLSDRALYLKRHHLK